MAESSRVTEKTSGISDALPTDALRDAGQRLLGLLVQRAAQAATERVGDLSNRLTDVADNGGTGLVTALRGRSDDDGDDEDREKEGGIFSRMGSALGSVKDKVQSALGGGGDSGGSGKKLKVTVISEDLDIGLPLRTTYNLWTQFGDFPGFMKKVETVDQESDEKTNWKAQVFWSHRTWEATIIEQVPDSHIVWKSKGAKGHVDGTVTFTELGRNLTRVLLVLEYWPKGLFERTGNIWRAQGRRARLEFKHFRRHAMTNAVLRQDEIEGWRGEIRDSEVVQTHAEALEEEQQGRELEEAAAEGEAPEEVEESAEAEEPEEEPEAEDYFAEDEEGAGDEDEAEEDVVGDEYDEQSEEAEGGPDDEYEAEYEAEDEDEDEADEGGDEELETDDGQARRREPVAARSRRGR